MTAIIPNPSSVRTSLFLGSCWHLNHYQQIDTFRLLEIDLVLLIITPEGWACCNIREEDLSSIYYDCAGIFHIL